MHLPNARLYLLVAALSLAGSFGGVLLGRAPVRNGGDEFAYLLGAQTFSAGRLTNPTHPLWEFFETFHVLLRPSYMAKYPPAQSLVLALGEKLGHPIIGVWLAGAAFAVATTWLLRARLAARWALLGGMLTVLQFGFTHYYTQSYWGGAVAATSGALIIGATLRLRRGTKAATAACVGTGAALGLLSRPFETILICLVPAFFWARHLLAPGDDRAHRRRNVLLVAIPIVVAAVLFQARLNHAVTGAWWSLPYTTYESQYSGAPLFVWQKAQPAPQFQHEVLAIFHKNFVTHSSRFDSPAAFVWLRRAYEFLLASLGPVLAVTAVLGSVFHPTRMIGRLWSVLAVSSIGFALSYWFFPHYYAGLHGAFIFIAVHGLRVGYLALRARRPSFAVFALAVLVACGITRVAADEKLRPLVTPLGHAREAIQAQLSADGEKHLVFVRRLRPFNFHFTWVYNDADIDGSAVVWAHDRGAEINRKLIEYYRGARRVWMLIERNDEPRLIPFTEAP